EALCCQWGCGLPVHACNHLQCPSGEPMKKEIAERLARGEDGETILAAFRTRYGEKVLSSPTLRGFNWLAWVTPFAAILMGGLGVTLVIRRWVRAPGPHPPRRRPPPTSCASASRASSRTWTASRDARRLLARSRADRRRLALRGSAAL